MAQLNERMDARFKTVDRRFRTVDQRFDAVDRRFDAVDQRFDQLSLEMDAGFSSMHDKLNAILRALKTTDDHQQEILDEHDHRLRDLETWRRTTRDIPG